VTEIREQPKCHLSREISSPGTPNKPLVNKSFVGDIAPKGGEIGPIPQPIDENHKGFESRQITDCEQHRGD
jgi:hypothetical protein